MFMLIIFVYRPILGHCDYYFSPLSIFFAVKTWFDPHSWRYFLHVQTTLSDTSRLQHTSVSLRPGRWPLPLFLGWCSPRHLGSQYIAYWTESKIRIVCVCIYIYAHIHLYIYVDLCICTLYIYIAYINIYCVYIYIQCVYIYNVCIYIHMSCIYLAWVCLHNCMHIYIYMYVCMNVHV
jgi:hypothetical protein